MCGYEICRVCNPTKVECPNGPKLHEPADLHLTQIIPSEPYEIVLKKLNEFLRNDNKYGNTHSDGASSLTKPLYTTTKKIEITTFRKYWKKGLPVIVRLDEDNDEAMLKLRELLGPKSLSKDFGDQTIDLVDCLNRDVKHTGYTLRKYFKGFTNDDERIIIDGIKVHLKIADWPKDKDFKDMDENRFEAYNAALPLWHYTHRGGVFNLIRYLPRTWNVPELGPRLYIGNKLLLVSIEGEKEKPISMTSVGTTNLHLDASDATNTMVYATPCKDVDEEQKILEVFRIAGCDMDEIQKRGAAAGALWHIFKPEDSDEIKKFIEGKRAKDNMEPIEDGCHAIHDQTWYLDDEQVKKLKEDHGVEGYAIAQFPGDTIFIPAGAPHQVRNLSNCIKIAQDFVSPENPEQKTKLKTEFRLLKSDHSNHADILQFDSTMYHATKIGLSVIDEKENCKDAPPGAICRCHSKGVNACM